MLRFIALVVLVAAVLLPQPPAAAAQSDTLCPPSGAPQFTGGFAQLKALLADWQGDPVTCEFADPHGTGDVLQQTTTGLAFWRRSTNTPSFTNGLDHWALTRAGQVYWTSSAPDPPADAQAGTAAHPCVARGTCKLAASTSLPIPSRAVESTPSVPTSEPIYQTRAGPRTASQLRGELAAAGYGGPWDSASLVAAYDRAGLHIVPPYPDDTAWSCLPANPSCARDPWWAERNELQDEDQVTYSAVGTHFVTERRFAEAVNLLWQSPEGKTLLAQADQSGVQLIALDYDQQTAFATYSPQRKLIAINRRFTTAPTWMVADVLAHELSHAAADAHGLHMGHNSADCLAGETAAFETQRRFLVWLTRVLEPQGLPSIGVVTARLSPEHAELARSLYQLGLSDNLPALVGQTYEGTC